MLGRGCCCGCDCIAPGTMWTDGFDTDINYSTTNDHTTDDSLCWIDAGGLGATVSGGSMVVALYGYMRRCVAFIADMDRLRFTMQATIVTKEAGSYSDLYMIVTGGGITNVKLRYMPFNNIMQLDATGADGSSLSGNIAVTTADGDIIKFVVEDTSSGSGTFSVFAYLNGTLIYTHTGKQLARLFDPTPGSANFIAEITPNGTKNVTIDDVSIGSEYF